MIMRKTEKDAVPTIDIKTLYPGDILLTTERSLTSWLIRKATRSQYSHVILHVGNGMLIDSRPTDGIFYRALTLVKAEPVNKHEYRILATVPKAIRIHVYRHKSLTLPQQKPGAVPQQALMFDMCEVLADKWGKDYSLLESLGLATPFLSWAPKFKRFVLRTVGRLGADKGKITPSEFCSQFVASALADLKIPAFNELRTESHPSPQDFADTHSSNMVRIKGSETRPDPLIGGDRQKLIDEQHLLNLHVGSKLNSYRKQQQHALSSLNDIDSITTRIITDTNNKLRERG